LCEGKKPACRFAGRLSPDEHDERTDEEQMEEFTALIKKIMGGMNLRVWDRGKILGGKS
jgi:hypothetical protein